MRAYSGEIDFAEEAAASVISRNVDYTKLSKEDFLEKKSMLHVQDGALVLMTPKEAMELEYKRSHPHGVIDAVADMPKDVPLIHVLTTTGRIDTYQVIGYGAYMSMPVATREVPGNPKTVYDVPSQNGFDIDTDGKTVSQRIAAYLNPDGPEFYTLLKNSEKILTKKCMTVKDATPVLLDFVRKLHDLDILSRLAPADHAGAVKTRIDNLFKNTDYALVSRLFISQEKDVYIAIRKLLHVTHEM